MLYFAPHFTPNITPNNQKNKFMTIFNQKEFPISTYTPEAVQNFAELQEIVHKPVHARKKLLRLRSAISQEIKQIFDSHYQNGDHTNFQNYLSKQGYILSSRNFQRIIAEKETDALSVSEKTQLIVLKHLFLFYQIESDQVAATFIRIIQQYNLSTTTTKVAK
jgi:hypothetical protein